MSKERVCAWMEEHREELVDFLRQLIQIPSVTGDEGPVQAFLQQQLQEMGLEVDCFVPSLQELRQHPGYVKESLPYEGRPNLVAKWAGRGGGRSLLFNGHVDVIPEGAAENWEHGPWSADIADGKMYGRGTSDMKSGVAAFTMAMKAVKACGLQPKGDVLAEYVMDEELTGNGTLACVQRGYRADAGICCETSSMQVQPGSIGRIWFDIRVKGKAAGIQRRDLGVSGIRLGWLVTQIVSEFEALRIEQVSHPLYPDVFGSVPCMIGQFCSGSYNSAFPDSALLKGSLATLPGEDSAAVKQAFAAFVARRAAEEEPWLRENPPEVVYTGYFAEPSEIPVDSPIVQTLCHNYETVLGQAPSISGRQGAADIRFLNQYGHTPTVIFGPGKTEQMHANNEWVGLEDYLHSCQVLACTLLDWCGYEAADAQ